MGVGIPGTGMVGLPIAIALGVVAGKSAYGLEVLKDVTPTDVEQGKQYIAERRVKISLKEGISEKLYVEAIVESESGHRATAVIAGQHTHFVYVEKDGKVLLDNRMPQGEEAGEDECELNLRKVYDFFRRSAVGRNRIYPGSTPLERIGLPASFERVLRT